MNEIVNGLGKQLSKVELALIPRGTGSDLVREHAIPHSVTDAVRVALEGELRPLDLGKATFHAWDGKQAQQYFANAAGAGISGAIARRVNDGTKGLGARGSYAWAVLAVFPRWRNCNVRLRVDSEQREGKMHEVIAAIGRYQAGGMKLCPDAIPDDGLFDVLILGDLSKADLAAQPAQDLPRNPPLPPQGGRTARQARLGRSRRAAAGPARRRAARDDPGRVRADSGRAAPTRARAQLSLRPGYFFAAGFFVGALRAAGLLAGFCRAFTCFSSWATRFSSASTPLTRR